MDESRTGITEQLQAFGRNIEYDLDIFPVNPATVRELLQADGPRHQVLPSVLEFVPEAVGGLKA